MASKKYIYRVTNRTPRARSKRLREIGSGSSSTTILMGGSSVSGGSGADGFSPTISFETEGSVLTVRVVNKTGIKEYEIDLGECTGVDALREEFEKCCREMTEEVKDLRATIDELKRMMNVVTFTVVPTPADAKVTINGEERASVSVFAGAEVEWRVEADGYITRTGSQAVTEDTTLEVVLADLGSLISSFSYDDIGAGGGSVLPKVEVLEGASLTYSGTGADTSTGAVSADSLGTTVKGRTRITTVTVTAELDGSTATASADVYQQANEVVRHEATGTTYSKPTITGGHTYDDISAGGGTVTPTAPAYNQAKTTGYTDTYTSGATAPGEYEDEIIRSGAALTYSGTGVDKDTGEVTAPSLGTTLKERTTITTSIVTVTMNGRSASKETDVWQEENKVESESSETTYGTPSVSLFYAKDIPAAGGTVTPTLSYSQTKTTGHSYTYSSGAVDSPEGTTETITSGATVTYSGAADSAGHVFGNDLGTTLKDRTLIATVTATVTMNGKTNSVATDVYQEANEVTETETSVTYGDVEVLEFSYYDVPAAGGTVYPTVSYRQMSYDTVKNTYTSGGTETSSTERGYITDGASVTYSGTGVNTSTGAVSADSLTTRVTDRTKITTATATVTMNGKSASKSADVYQEANEVTMTEEMTGEHLEFGTFEYDDIPAGGGTVYPNVEVLYVLETIDVWSYTSGEQTREDPHQYRTPVTPDSVVYSTERLIVSYSLDTSTGAATAVTASPSTERKDLFTVTALATYTSPETGETLAASATADVWQEGREVWLRADPDSLTFDGSGGQQRVDVDSSTGSYEYETSADWISAKPRKGIPTEGGSSSLVIDVTADANMSYSARSGYVTLTNDDGCVTDIAVEQEAAGGEKPGETRTLTIKISGSGVGPTPGDDWTETPPTVTVTADGVVVQGTVTVDTSSMTWKGNTDDGARVTYTVSKDGYATVTGTVTMDSDRTVYVVLDSNKTIDVTLG